MRFFQLFRKSDDVEGANEPAHPDAIRMRAQELLQSGETEDAFNVLKEGYRQFPKSTRLRELYKSVEEHRLREQIIALNAGIEAKPQPTKYIALVDAYLQDGNRVAARHVCMEGLTKFPGDAELCLRIGEIFLGLFREGGLAKNGQLAIQNLEKCLLRLPGNRRAVLGLLEIYSAIGATSKALHLFGMLMESDAIRNIYNHTISRVKAAPDDIRRLLWEYERQNAFGNVTPEVPRYALRPVKVEDDSILSNVVANVSKIAGHVGTVVVARNGSVTHCRTAPNVTEDVVREVANSIIETAKNCSARMELGTFEEEDIATPEGHAFVRATSTHIVFVIVDKSCRRSKVMAEMARLSFGNQMQVGE